MHAVARERARYKGSGRVSAGSDKWLDLELWTDTWQCLKTLKGRGYRIAVTCMDELGEGRETRPIHEVRILGFSYGSGHRKIDFEGSVQSLSGKGPRRMIVLRDRTSVCEVF